MFHTPKFDVLAKAVFDAKHKWKLENDEKEPEMCIYVEYEYHREVLREIGYRAPSVSKEASQYLIDSKFLGCKVWPVIQNLLQEKPPTFNICITGEQEA